MKEGAQTRETDRGNMNRRGGDNTTEGAVHWRERGREPAQNTENENENENEGVRDYMLKTRCQSQVYL